MGLDIKQPPFPRVGDISLVDTSVSISEEWRDSHGDPDEAREMRRKEHFAGVEAAFSLCIRHLQTRGFTAEPDSKVDKLIRRYHWVGRKGGLEFHSRVSGRTAKVEFFQNVTKSDNPYGGQYDFDKFQRMPRDLRAQCVVEVVHLIRAMQSMGYTFDRYSYLYEPLPLAALRAATGRATEDLSPLERHNKCASPGDQLASWPTPEELSVGQWSSTDRTDKNGRLLCNGDVRYFYDHFRRLQRGTVYKTSHQWSVYLPGNVHVGSLPCDAFFWTEQPELLPRKRNRETQVSRVAHELGKARHLQSLIGGAEKHLSKKLPSQLAWMATILWAGAMDSSAKRVAALERAVARLSGGKPGYYVLSRKEPNRNESLCNFWRPSANGYVWNVNHAGRFEESQILERPTYYDNEETTFAVPIEAVERLVGADGCVKNTEKNRRAMYLAAGGARGARGQESVLARRKTERLARKATKNSEVA